jgi:hypothetical protein
MLIQLANESSNPSCRIEEGQMLIQLANESSSPGNLSSPPESKAGF